MMRPVARSGIDYTRSWLCRAAIVTIVATQGTARASFSQEEKVVARGARRMRGYKARRYGPLHRCAGTISRLNLVAPHPPLRGTFSPWEKDALRAGCI